MKHASRPFAFPALLLAALPAFAQEPQKQPQSPQGQHAPSGPAKELEKLKPFVGNWEGSGTASMPEPSKWTSRSSYQWVLDGHWLQVDTTVTFDGNHEELQMREYLGWDAENKRYVGVTVDNGGHITSAPAHVGDGELLQFIARETPHGPMAERVHTKIDGDSMAFKMTMVMGTAPAQDCVQGAMKRTSSAKPKAIDAAAGMKDASTPEMTKLARMAGTYEVTGEMTMMPGQPAMKITGTDAYSPLFGGAALLVTTKGAAEGMPGAYEAHGYYAWNASERCYAVFSVDNMGMLCEMKGYPSGDDKIVLTACGRAMGQACASSTVMKIDANGAPVSFLGYACCDGSEPYKAFSATYKKASGAAKAPKN